MTGTPPVIMRFTPAVSAVIVTRGDVDVTPVLDSLPDGWERVVWDNSDHERNVDLAVYGRYAAIERASGDVIYVQDDDVIVSDPQAIVDAWTDGLVVCNMPPEFRHRFYERHALVGFGAAFHPDAPRQAFARMARAVGTPSHFAMTCDIVFTGMTPRRLVNVPVRNLGHATVPDRMYRQGWHQTIRNEMLRLVDETLAREDDVRSA